MSFDVTFESSELVRYLLMRLFLDFLALKLVYKISRDAHYLEQLLK